MAVGISELIGEDSGSDHAPVITLPHALREYKFVVTSLLADLQKRLCSAHDDGIARATEMFRDAMERQKRLSDELLRVQGELRQRNMGLKKDLKTAELGVKKLVDRLGARDSKLMGLVQQHTSMHQALSTTEASLCTMRSWGLSVQEWRKPLMESLSEKEIGRAMTILEEFPRCPDSISPTKCGVGQRCVVSLDELADAGLTETRAWEPMPTVAIGTSLDQGKSFVSQSLSLSGCSGAADAADACGRCLLPASEDAPSSDAPANGPAYAVLFVHPKSPIHDALQDSFAEPIAEDAATSSISWIPHVANLNSSDGCSTPHKRSDGGSPSRRPPE